jgi:bifunctional NMN adenylyltransferase/nudix hydrolase
MAPPGTWKGFAMTDDQQAALQHYDYAVYMGRFQLPTTAHLASIQCALALADTVIIVIGSHRQSRDLRNPFTSEEREVMITAMLSSDEKSRLRFIYQQDVGNRTRWSDEVQAKVGSLIAREGVKSPSIALVGPRKDATSAYLDDFPAWDLIDAPVYEQISATDMRDGYFSANRENFEQWQAGATAGRDGRPAIVHPEVAAWLRTFTATEEYATLALEAKARERYLKPWQAAPHPPIFVTADAVVIQAGKVLLVRRGILRGKAGYWGCPGGFVGQQARVFDTAVEALIEETRIDLSRSRLVESLVETWVEDEPFRSTRGRTITHVHLFHLRPRPQGHTAAERHASLAHPRVKGVDGTHEARWFAFTEIEAMREQLLEDHAVIINKALDRLAGRIGR